MTTGIYFLLQSIFFSVLLTIIYFNKKRIKNLENKIYTYLVITSLVELIMELILDTIMPIYNEKIILSTLIAKTYCATIMIWLTLLISYVTSISLVLKKKTENIKTIKTIFTTFAIINILAIYLLPINFFYENKIYYTTGPSVNVDYIVSFIYVLIGIICLIWNRENIKNKKYYPLFIFMILGGITGFIQMNNPSLLLSTAVHTFITFIMYFTIENPDLKMVEELNKNRKITEQNFEEKSNFIFKISQDLKQPLNNITELSNELIEKTKGETQEKIKIINNNSKQLYTYVNSALDVSNMDIKNLKIVTSKYNTKNFFEEIKLRMQAELKAKGKDIEFRYEISNNIPKKLSGDNTRLKQVILSILFDSIKHTEKGFIELNINSIAKYGVCRLIIEITDSGKGIDIDKVNTILSTTGELTIEEIEKIDKLNIPLQLTNKIIKTLNGSFIIKSEVNKGTNFLIIIDQKIEDKEIEDNSKKISSNKKALILTTDNKIVKTIEKELDEIEIINTLYGKDCIDKLNKDKYEFVLIDDELKNESSLDILKEIKEIPVFIMMKENRKFIAKHYIEDGFKEFLIKENMQEELKKINKYL